MTEALPPMLRTALPSAPQRLTRQMIQESLANNALHRGEIEVLRWLVWLSLLSSEELSQLVLKIDGTVHDPQTVRGWLGHLEALHLIEHIVCHEAGWPRHYRYYLSDLGIYTLVAHYPPEAPGLISVSKLARSYPVTRQDLLARLARLPVHLVLAGWISRLISACPPGYTIASYQQPWAQFYTNREKRHFWHCDAAFLLATPRREAHAFYIRVDSSERLFGRREEMASLLHLLDLRLAAEFLGEQQPPLLICTTPARFPFWAEQLVQATRLFTRPLPAGAIADISRLTDDPYGPIWIPFFDLVKGEIKGLGPGPNAAISLLAMLDQKASPALIERFSQHHSFQALLRSKTGSLSRRSLRLYVYDSLQEEAQHLRPQASADFPLLTTEFAEEFYGPKEERTRMTALLNLLLTAQQKTILGLLVRHPWLCLPDLLAQMHPAPHSRRLQMHLQTLIGLGLLRQQTWPVSSLWQERERYSLTETALRYLAARHNFSPMHYLFAVADKQPSGAPPGPQEQDRSWSQTDSTVLWLQRGAGMMQKQKHHTHGLYCCIRSITAQGRASGGYDILFWRSARESVRFYQSSDDREDIAYPRPDAELLYRPTTSSEHTLRRLLIEYDKGTSWGRE